MSSPGSGSPPTDSDDLEPGDSLTLWDYRRRVADLYARVRSLPPAEGWEAWRRGRDLLFATHPQSPIPAEARPGFPGLTYFPYDPALRMVASVEPGSGERVSLPHSGHGTTPARAFGVARFRLSGDEHRLTLFRLDAYGDAIIVPFGDATNGDSTYGGGRYLVDTAKGADLGGDGDAVVLDFNFAYHPSCVHDPRWSCPLAPPTNRLAVAVEAGERIETAS
jgi:uncharacterized protein